MVEAEYYNQVQLKLDSRLSDYKQVLGSERVPGKGIVTAERIQKYDRRC